MIALVEIAVVSEPAKTANADISKLSDCITGASREIFASSKLTVGCGHAGDGIFVHLDWLLLLRSEELREYVLMIGPSILSSLNLSNCELSKGAMSSCYP